MPAHPGQTFGLAHTTSNEDDDYCTGRPASCKAMNGAQDIEVDDNDADYDYDDDDDNEEDIAAAVNTARSFEQSFRSPIIEDIGQR